MKRLLIVLCLLLIGCIGKAEAMPLASIAKGIAAIQSIQLVPLSDYRYRIYECDIGYWPAIKGALLDEGIYVVAHRVNVRRAWGLLYKNGWIATLSAHNMGIRVAGKYVWSVFGPKQAGSAFNIPECAFSRKWTQVLTLAPAPKAWIMERSTCHGEGTLLGRTFTSWPCIWETSRGLSVTTIDYVSPPVYSGGSIDATNLDL